MQQRAGRVQHADICRESEMMIVLEQNLTQLVGNWLLHYDWKKTTHILFIGPIFHVFLRDVKHFFVNFHKYCQNTLTELSTFQNFAPVLLLGLVYTTDVLPVFIHLSFISAQRTRRCYSRSSTLRVYSHSSWTAKLCFNIFHAFSPQLLNKKHRKHFMVHLKRIILKHRAL